MNLSTRQLRAFLHVAGTGNFTRAAERAHMTQAGLSILVRELERQIGARLFDRTTRAVELTEAGRRLADVAESVLRQLDDVTEQAGAMGALARQQLRIAATPLVSSHLLPQLLARFRDAHPGVSIRLVDANLQTVQEMVESGNADLGLGFFFKVGSGLARRHVADFPLIKVSPAETLPRTVGRAGWASLKATPLIALPADNPIQRAIDQHLHKAGVEQGAQMSVSFIATLIAMVEAGFGSAVMPSFALAACRRHHVRVDLLDAPRVKLGFYRISRRGAAHTEVIQAFDEVLVEQLPRMGR